MKKLFLKIEEIVQLRAFSVKVSPKISSVNVGWHLEHSLLVISKIIEGLKASKPENYAPKNNFVKFFVMNTGYIPRNKGKAPKITLPESNDDHDFIAENVEFIRNNFSQLSSLHPHSFIEHPYFGHLNLKETMKFLLIHTNHHLKIVKDILK